MERLTSSEESGTVSLKLWPPYTQGLVMPREVENDVLDGEDEQMLQALASWPMEGPERRTMKPSTVDQEKSLRQGNDEVCDFACFTRVENGFTRKQERTWEDELEVCSRRDTLSAMQYCIGERRGIQNL